MGESEGQGSSKILWQLQQYQYVIRTWDRYLDPYEFKVIMQILDRTIGWQRDEATFRPHAMLNGDRMYAGFGNTVSRSKLMKVLRALEDRGMVARRADPYRPGLKSYSINLDWLPETAGTAALTERSDVEHLNTAVEPVSVRDGGVRHTDGHAFSGDNGVSNRDPEERYQDNAIFEQYRVTSIGVDPRPSASDQRLPEFSPGKGLEDRAARFQAAPAINPPARKRRAS